MTIIRYAQTPSVVSVTNKRYGHTYNNYHIGDDFYDNDDVHQYLQCHLRRQQCLHGKEDWNWERNDVKEF